MSQLSFLALSLALPAILCAAQLARRLLERIADSYNEKKLLEGEHSANAESLVLTIMYWLCLGAALMVDICSCFERVHLADVYHTVGPDSRGALSSPWSVSGSTKLLGFC